MNEELLLNVCNVRKNFLQPDGTVLNLLRGIDLIMKKGEAVAITGVSGSGKSTLLHIIGTLDSADEGSVCFLNQEIAALKPQELALFRNQRLGFVFQFHYLIAELTVLENVALPLLLAKHSLKKACQRAAECLEMVDLLHRRDHYPFQLSGGEKQRAAIARALANTPLLLLADEPTGNLDLQTAESVFNFLFSTVKNNRLALVVVTHNQQLAFRCDSSYLLENGKLHLLSQKS